MRRAISAVAVAAMALSTSMASAGTGWYLLRPPIVEREDWYVPNQAAPLHVWEHAGAYDTAQTCEAAVSRMSDTAFSKLKAWAPMPATATQDRRRADKQLMAIYVGNTMLR